MFCFLYKQKTAYEMRISDWSSDVCSSDLSTIPELAAGSSQEPHPPSSRVAGPTHAKGQGQGHHMTAFTDRLSRAVDYARIAHARQVRKGTHVPYLSPVLGVAALVIDYGEIGRAHVCTPVHNAQPVCRLLL